MPPGDRQGHFRPHRVFEAVAGHVDRLRLAVDIDPGSGRTARTVVGDHHVMPFAGLDRRLRDDLDGVVGPVVDQMRAGPVVLQPHVPAAEGVAVVHAGHHGPAADLAGELDPAPVGKCLLAVEVARLGNFQRGLVLGHEGLGGDLAGAPGRVGRQGQRAGLRIDRNRHAAALALAQGRVEPQAIAGHAGRKRLPGRTREPISRNRPGPPACGR